MQRHQSYTMPYASSAATSKYTSSHHSTSSAFSASANPNEDWTKISDLAERRRIQNRIAQRNYRKKIKRRLEDLEKRASSSSPERVHAELAPSQRGHDASKRRRSKTESQAQQQQRQRIPEPISTPFFPEAKQEFSSPEQFGRELSVSPPPAFGQSYSLPDPSTQAGFYPPSNVHSLPTTYPEYSSPQYYLPHPTTLPSMPPFEASKPGSGYYDSEDMLNQYSVGGYPSFSTSMELPMQQSYPDSNVHVNHPEYSFHFQYPLP